MAICLRIALVWMSCGPASAQGRLDMAAVELVVAVTGGSGQAATSGAGIIFAREKDQLFVVTANHVVRSGGREGVDLKVRLKLAPDVALKARLLPQMDAASDLAVLVVDDVANIDTCRLNLEVVASPAAIARGLDVYPVGNPGGEPWVVPPRPDAIAEVRDDQVIFQSTVLARGHSGGALIDAGGRLVGLIQADEPPYGRALDVRRITDILTRLNMPMQWRTPDADGWPALFSALRSHDEREVKRLLSESCTDVNATTSRDLTGGITALHVAAEGPANLVQLVLDAGARISVPDSGKQTPLSYAVRVGNFKAAQMLLGRGASATEQGVLPAAVDRGTVEIVGLLLAAGADPNAALFDAVREYRSIPDTTRQRLLALLIQFGAAVNVKDKEGDTPLSLAVARGCALCVRTLLEAGADVRAKNHRNESPLFVVTWTSANWFRDIALLLLEHTTSVDSDESERLLGHLGADGADIVHLLAKHGALDRRASATYAALAEAAKGGHADVLGALLEAGVDPNSGGGRTPLQQALGVESRTPLDAATRLRMVKMLLAKGARVNIDSSPYYFMHEEPLYLALISLTPPELEIASLLIASGANVNPRHEAAGISLLDVAEDLKRPDVVKLLLRHGAKRR